MSNFRHGSMMRAARTAGVLLLLTLAAAAADKDSDTPAFADGWRLSGILKQGARLQASMEHAGHPPRYVVEGGELVPGARVEKIDATSRAVTVRKGNLIAIIRSGSSPVVVKSSPLPAPGAPQPGQSPVPQPEPPPFPPSQPMSAKTTQDANGHWGIQLSDGRFLSAADYAARYGSVEQAITSLNNRLAGDTPPERKAFAQQMLNALQSMQAGKALPAATSDVAAGSPATPVPSATTPPTTVSPATASTAPVPSATEPQAAAFSLKKPAVLQDAGSAYRRGPKLTQPR